MEWVFPKGRVRRREGAGAKVGAGWYRGCMNEGGGSGWVLRPFRGGGGDGRWECLVAG